MMVVERNMDVNKEAQDYLAQFSIPVRNPPVDSNLESMLDTWTREKYKSKGYGKKSSSNHSSYFPKEWDKVQGSLGTVFDYDSSHLEYMADNILYPENMDVTDSLDNVQDTYMNEEAFLEQLLQNDTTPHKSRKGKKPIIKNKHEHDRSTSNKHLYPAHTTHQLPSTSMQPPASSFVAGQHVSNKSRRAVLRRGVCKEDANSSKQLNQNVPIKNSESRQHYLLSLTSKKDSPQSATSTVEIPDNDEEFQDNITSLQEIHPICQKCGWHLSASLEEVLDTQQIHSNSVNTPFQTRSNSNSVDNSCTNSSVQSGEDNLSTTDNQAMLNHLRLESPQILHNRWQESSKSKKISPNATLQSSLNSSNVSLSHPETPHSSGLTSAKTPDYSNSHRNQQQSQQNQIAKATHLTTSKHCQTRASQTDPNLLSQDLSPFAEIVSLGGSDSSNMNSRNRGSFSKSHVQGTLTKGKPPSGRHVKTDVAITGTVTSSNNISHETIPVIEAAKSGNVETLVHLISSDPDSWKMNDVQGNSLLHITAECGHISCVQYIAENFPVLCQQENKGKFTPAALSIKAGHAEVLEWLLDNTQARDEILPVSNKKSLLHHAAKFGQDSCLRIVLEKMSPQDRNNSCCDSNGNSPAHVAAKHGNLLCLQSLVEYGVDATKANKYGHSPCYYADFSNHRLCAGYLMVVETCLNLAKKLIRLERSMEQLSNSLAKYSDNQNGIEVPLSYDYNADRSSATSSVEDDGTRDEAWQLLCRKFEEASKRLVVFRTQNRAIRPLRPSKLALLALAQTKEETQAVVNKLKAVSANDLADDTLQQECSPKVFHDNRSKSFSDLPSAVMAENSSAASNASSSRSHGNMGNSNSNVSMNTESAFVLTGIPSNSKLNEIDHDDHNTITFKEFERGLNNDYNREKKDASKGHEVQVRAEIHNDFCNSMGNNTLKNGTLKSAEHKVHRRSSSLGDIIDSNFSLHKVSDDLEYHLETRVVPSSPAHSKNSDGIGIDVNTNLPKSNNPPPPVPPRLSSARNSHNVKRGNEPLPPPPPLPTSMPPPLLPSHTLENEQTSDFFEEITNGKYDSDNISDIDQDTLQKIIDMQEEIMKCGASSFKKIAKFSKSSRIRTPEKLELTPEDFNETYARKSQDELDFVEEEDDDDNMEGDLSLQNFRRIPLTVRLKYGDALSKLNIVTQMDNINAKSRSIQEDSTGLEDNSNFSKPWYEMTDEDEIDEADTSKNKDNDEYFTLL